MKSTFFGRRATKYDSGLEGYLSQPFYKLVLSSFQNRDSTAVLDVGCGTGALLQLIDKHNNITGYGIDAERNMVSVARKKLPHMKFVKARCEDMPFSAESFDAITVCMAFHHFSNRKGFAKEAARVLRKGGLLYIAELNLPELVRTPLNLLFKTLGVNGKFFSAQEISSFFSRYGFSLRSVDSDRYAQVVVLCKNNSRNPR